MSYLHKFQVSWPTSELGLKYIAMLFAEASCLCSVAAETTLPVSTFDQADVTGVADGSTSY